MTISDHALRRMNERVTVFNYKSALSFVKGEMRGADPRYAVTKEGRTRARYVINGIVYIVDVTSLEKKTLVTVFLESEKEEWEK
ncbi:hypothetical protein [Rossellomorea aquimaris]|uniref:DUF4258 domain-containing protein n=1 Tax=Rossellomorea aquimaris TaxID=189382 RepID=A0A5D4TLR9_9BACI|nr:hypothetical protein [Rossellomorea aquimaris]TYS75761.1 hypothetical protein FZC80_16290 [Rossellomorea aquimaris]